MIKGSTKHKLPTHYYVNGKRRLSRLYQTWADMKQRCYNPKCSSYEYCGARGITVCESWLEYGNFEAWALANGYEDSLTLDRQNNDKNYEPSNCRWITNLEQQANKRGYRRKRRKL